MNKIVLISAMAVVSLMACINQHPRTLSGDKWLNINQETGTGWKSVNAPADHWVWAGDTLVTQNNSYGYLRSPQLMENYLLSFEAMITKEEGKDLLLSATALPAMGSPYPEGIPIKLKTGNWNTYLVESREGRIRIFENNKLIYTAANPHRTKGYICFLKSENRKSFRKIRLNHFDRQSASQEVINPLMNAGFDQLYTGENLDQWEMKPGHKGHWTAQGWIINYDGLSQEKDKCLWTKKAYKDFELIADWRLTREPSKEWTPVVLPTGENARNEDGTVKQVLELYAGDTGIYLRGHSKNQINIGYRYIGSGEIYGYRVDRNMPAEIRAAVTPKVKADNLPGEWNRFIIRMTGDRLTIFLNGQLVIDNAQLPGIAAEGPIALQDDHASDNRFQFANLFIREL